MISLANGATKFDHARAQVIFTMSYFLLSGLWALQTIVMGTASPALGGLVVTYMAIDVLWIWSRPELRHHRNLAVLLHHVGAALAVLAMFAHDTVYYNGFLLTLELSGFMTHVLWHFRFEPDTRRALEIFNAALWMFTRFVVPGVAVVILFYDSVPMATKAVVYLILFVGIMPIQVLWTVTHVRRGFRIKEKFKLLGREPRAMAPSASL